MLTRPAILIIDDDAKIRTLIRSYLEAEMFEILEAENGGKMREILATASVDLVLLDLNLPGEDGLTLARFIRQSSLIPIIMLTGKTDVIDRVAGLEAGADDYISKPFHLRELLARIRTVLRRTLSSPVATTPQAKPSSQMLRFANWRLDLHRRILISEGNEDVALTTSEFEMLRVLAEHGNRVLSRDTLMDLTKGRDCAPYDRSIDTQIGRIRKKIEANAAKPSLLKTVRGGGYVLAATVTAE
jgi:two-component system, OmpR family, response regulator